MPISATSAKPAQKLMSADDALARILAGVPTLPAVATPLLETLGLVLAEDVAADRDVPPFRNSAMDGYAVRGDDVASAPVELRVVGQIAAGEFPERAVAQGKDAVDQHMPHARSSLVGLERRAALGEARGVEDGKVGARALLDEAAVLEP